MGSAYSGRLAHRARQREHSPIVIAVGGIAVITLLYLVLLPALFHQLIGLADGIKVVLSVLLIAPLAFCMGMPFRIGLSRLADSAPDFIPWAWDIIRFASVLSAALAPILAIEFGFTAVVLLALGLYAAAAAITWNNFKQEVQSTTLLPTNPRTIAVSRQSDLILFGKPCTWIEREERTGTPLQPQDRKSVV